MSNKAYIFLVFILFICACRSHKITTPPSIKSYTSEEAMVASAHPLATQAGLRILKKGGNAIDAAVAVQFALAVVYPNAGNIGGGGFMIYRNQQGEHFALDYREMAPAAADKDMYLDAQGEVIPRLSLDGHLAAGVPGSVAGMVEAHHRFGKTAWKDLLQAAIDLAARGFTLTHQQAEGLNRYQEAFKKLNTHRPAFIKDSPWKAGDVLVQKELAATLRRIQAEGRAGFYEGTTADFIVAEMKAGNGIISHEDLKNYRAKWREPISFAYKDFQVVSMPPPSSGGIALAQLLKIIEDYPIASWGVHSVPSVHLMVEAERRVYADRASHLGDADFYPVPIETLLDKDYLKNRMADFNPDKATPSSEIIAGTIGKESEETTHFSIVDKQGNAVSITTTLNGSYGAKTVVSGAGFLLNNEMDDFSAKPGVPNLYGLVGAEANAIAPGKRMLSSMTPTIVSKDGDLYMVVGTPGGSTIITSVFQTFLNVAEFGMPVSEAVQAPRFHHQWLPDRLFVEEDCLSENTRAALENMGHHIKERASIGRVEAILLLPNGKLSGAADKRGDDSVGGF